MTENLFDITDQGIVVTGGNGTILYLLSEASAYIASANLVIDGGYTAW